jgi:hypothetical protein
LFRKPKSAGGRIFRIFRDVERKRRTLRSPPLVHPTLRRTSRKLLLNGGSPTPRKLEDIRADEAGSIGRRLVPMAAQEQT